MIIVTALGSPAILGSFGESFYGFSEEARTRGFASLTLVRFAFVKTIMRYWKSGSILGCT